MAMAITLVSPIEPGIKPKSMSAIEPCTCVCCAISPNGVAAVKVSGRLLPNPKMEWVATHTASPVIFEGYEKKRKARAQSATLKMFIPVPPKISLQIITEKATASASTHNGQFTGIIKGIKIPVTKNPSCISSPFHCAQANSIPSPTA